MKKRRKGNIDFEEKKIQSLDLRLEENLASLIVNYLCGETLKNANLDSKTKEMIREFQRNIGKEGLNFEQFNELLLLLNQNRVSKGFFDFFFAGPSVDFVKLKKGVIKFRGFAMLRFGNFRFAYKDLIKKAKEDLERTFEPFYTSQDLFSKRPTKVLDIEKIERSKVWYLGYISGKRINKEAELLDRLRNFPGRAVLKTKLDKMQKELTEFQKIALRNTDVYLTWDYVDIYVATSMRDSWEFEETYDFIGELCKENTIKDSNLRFFDPTQSICENPRDKGLIEGLMLKRTSITIYMVQASDTMGKDSELAVTLAQSKPVIAYIPKYTSSEYAERLKTYPLEYFKKRILVFKAEELFEDEKLERKIKREFSNFEKIIEDFLADYSKYRKCQPFTLWKEKDEEFARKNENFAKIVKILAIAECFHFDERAKTLRKSHPLSMQVDLQSGVANGVLVVRDVKKCSSLIEAILNKNMTFGIEHKTEGYYVLNEKISESPFRVITDNEKLTNSFWNFFKT